MSDQRDEQTPLSPPEPPAETEPSEPSFTLEEILSEFSSTNEKKEEPIPRVVQFPPQQTESSEPEDDGADSEDGLSGPRKDREQAPVIDLPNRNLVFVVKEKMRALFRRADEYADEYAAHMYQQAEISEEDLESEQYIPGVDEEEFPEDYEDEAYESPFPPRREPLFHRKAKPMPPDISPKELAGQFKKELRGTKLRLQLSVLVFVAAVYAALGPMPELGLDEGTLRLFISVIALSMTTLLCYDVIIAGIADLITLRPGVETLCAFSALVTLADGLSMPALGMRENTLPCAAPSCLVLIFALWGRRTKREAEYLSCKTASQAREPYLLTLDEAKWSGRPAYSKWSGLLQNFSSQMQCPDGVQNVYRVAAPLLILACIGCSLMASVGREVSEHFLWTFSNTLTAASTLTGLTAYALPYRKITARLNKIGATLAGWPGVRHASGHSLILTDTDLFPPGSIRFNGVKIFGDFPSEKVIAYTATLIRATRCGLMRPFSDLMKSHNALYRPVFEVQHFEGGTTGVIRNQEVMVGTAAFFHLMGVALPQGVGVRNAIFCAIDGELAGIFALHYALHKDVSPCLTALLRNRISPLLATRDPNILPSMLSEKFKLPVNQVEFPNSERRIELSNPDQIHNTTLTAVLLREGLTPYSDSAVGASRLRTAVRLGSLLSVIGAILGVLLTFYLTFVDAYRSLSPSAMMLFLLAWFVPTLVLTDWVSRF